MGESTCKLSLKLGCPHDGNKGVSLKNNLREIVAIENK
jgi:hypothetical protein